MPRDTSGPAFPRPASIVTFSSARPAGDAVAPDQTGLTKREEFAGRMLAAILAHNDVAALLVADFVAGKEPGVYLAAAQAAAVKAADGLLKELAK